jgi:phospholipid/cholesterol/gamma-HCH transport system substrate-binding protein
MKNSLETRLGLFFALALIAAIILIEMIGGLDFFKKGYHVRSLFNSVLELKKGDPVKMAGVEIGRVERINPPSGGKVEVIMKLDDKTGSEVKTDSKATIKFTGLLGQNFVSVSFGSPNAPRIAEGQLLESTEQPDLSTIMSRLDNVASGVEGLAKNLSGDNLNNLLGPFVDFMKQNNPRLSVILGNMQAISSQIAEGKGTLGRMINDDTLYVSAVSTVSNINSTMNSTSEDLKAILGPARTTIAEINEGRGTLGKLAKDETLYRETTTAMANLREVLEKVNKGQGSVGKLVNDESLYRNARLTLQKVEKATESLEDQGPLSVVGLVVGSLF